MRLFYDIIGFRCL